MNLTRRHGISIKLNNRFDMNKLRDIIYDDEIGNDIIIPQKDRILIFEDVDCMGELLKDRTLKNTDTDKSLYNNKDRFNSNKNQYASSDSEDNNSSQIVKKINCKTNEDVITKSITDSDNAYNNNLSYFLNILDGLQECPGRIIIMTTNKPGQLDKAFIRPGRIDFNINFTKASSQDIENMLDFYWKRQVSNLPKPIDNLYSHAEIINFCRTSESLESTIKKLGK
jgi:chaperone BCS1